MHPKLNKLKVSSQNGMLCIIAVILILIITGPLTAGTNYYVNDGTGNDDNNGLTPGTAWQTISRGDVLGVLQPGDTISVAAGTYSLSSAAGVVLTMSGDATGSITYKADGHVVVQQASGVGTYGFNVIGSYTVIDGFEIVGPQWGVYLTSGTTNNTVANCVIHNLRAGGNSNAGVMCDHSLNNLVHHNLLYDIGDPISPAWYQVGVGAFGTTTTQIYNNTIDRTWGGVLMNEGGSGIVIKNNIVSNTTWVGIQNYINAAAATSSHNILYNNLGGLYPFDTYIRPGYADVYGDPKYVDAASGDYRLQSDSVAVNSGLDLSLPFEGPAPDRGAVESSFTDPVGYVTGKVTGNVADHPQLPGCTVGPTDGSYWDVTGHPTIAQAGTDGVYVVPMRAGLQTLRAVGSGWLPKEQNIDVIAGSEVTLDFDLDVRPGLTYYVSETGDDNNDGLTPGTAWRTINNGDNKFITQAGDTILVGAGTYPQTSLTKRPGNAVQPITYKATGRAVIDVTADSPWQQALVMHLDYAVIDGFEVVGGQLGILITDWRKGYEVRNCVTHDQKEPEPDSPDWGGFAAGIHISTQTNGIVHHNLCYDIGFPGATGRHWAAGIMAHAPPTAGNRIYNNTVVNCWAGILFYDGGKGTVANNVITNMEGYGMYYHPAQASPVENYYNLFYNNPANYSDNWVAGAGDISADPMFVNPSSQDYHLQSGSPAIDTGAYVGLPFTGIAPDLGAYEFPTSVTLTPVAKLLDLKELADGTPVQVQTPMVVSVKSTTFGDGSYYVQEQDRSSGIKVIGQPANAGDMVTLNAILDTEANGERVLRNAISLSKISGALLTPLGMTNKTLGGASNGFQPGITGANGTNNIGLLVTVFGKVVNPGTGEFGLDDGSGVSLKVILPPGAGVPTEGMFVTVIGISSCEKSGSDYNRVLKSIGAVHVPPGAAGIGYSTFGDPAGKQIWIRAANYAARSADGGTLDFVPDIKSMANALSGIAYNFPDPAGQSAAVLKPWWVKYEIPQAKIPFSLNGDWVFWARVSQSVNSGYDADSLIVKGDPGDLDYPDLGTPATADRILNNLPGVGLYNYTFGWFSSENAWTLRTKTFSVIDDKVEFMIYEREAGPSNALIDVICWSDNANYVPSDADLLSVSGW
ncbi:MAG: right-handed parallel beta-helix repeat-containing protein [Armatimonadetes bacterium]|nr:right-handed parallel beta-helix repeat-containing protein [Armatimonadota bacterium]